MYLCVLEKITTLRAWNYDWKFERTENAVEHEAGQASVSIHSFSTSRKLFRVFLLNTIRL